MTGWLVNDKLTCIPGTRTFWNHLLDGIPGLANKTNEPFSTLARSVEDAARSGEPDYIVRNAAYFRWLNVDCPVIAFVQDILHGLQRDALVESCAASRYVVFNSEYTESMYPELHAADHLVIPIGTDDSIFHPVEPQEGIPEGSVLWVGSGHPVKGFDLACQLANESDRPWVFVMKDDTPVDVAALTLRRVDQRQLASIASACSVGVCTSREETQHLAGIEMGMCGLPLLTTNVGVYYEREAGPWGQRSRGDWLNEIESVSSLSGAGAALYWRGQGFTLHECMASWASLIGSLETANVVR